MDSVRIQSGGNFGVLNRRFANVRDGFDQKSGSRSLAISTGRFKKSRSSISARKSLQPVNRSKNVDEMIPREKLDEWMKESVVDIVKNLQRSPLVLRIYEAEDGEAAARFETEKAVEEDRWRILEKQWNSGEAATPEGVIFVRELEDGDEGDSGGGGESKAWGIVVQGRCVERGAPICYLLKTSSAAGLGLWCTHFCLVRVKNFRETTRSQLQNCWLPQNC